MPECPSDYHGTPQDPYGCGDGAYPAPCYHPTVKVGGATVTCEGCAATFTVLPWAVSNFTPPTGRTTR